MCQEKIALLQNMLDIANEGREQKQTLPEFITNMSDADKAQLPCGMHCVGGKDKIPAIERPN
jgi:hypothetical protein